MSNILPEHDYVMFGSLLSQICMLSVTFVRPIQQVETLGNISLPFCTSAILWPPMQNFTKCPRGTPPLGALNTRGVEK